MSSLLTSVYSAWTGHVAGATAEDLARPTRADAWTLKELLLHQLLDARRALVTLNSPADRAPDVDEVTYWHDFAPGSGDDGGEHARFVVASAAAYSPEALVAEWRETSAAAAHAVQLAGDDVVATQGHAISVADLTSTLVLEATVHLLDAHGTPPPDAVAHAERVLAGLRGRPLDGSGVDEVLRATGRAPSDAPDYPLLG